jgi:arsenite methyltransferase
MASASPPTTFDTKALRHKIRETYTRVATHPQGEFHFHRGTDYACERLGYQRQELDALPSEAVDRFAGVGNPLAAGRITAGLTVLDHACGSGTDVLLAARRVGPSGKVIGVDMTSAMRELATVAAKKAGLDQIIEIREGYLEQLPVDDASVDVVISNGVINLSPDKDRVFSEVVRVLKPGGFLSLADVTMQYEFTENERMDPDLWAACIGGAMTENELYGNAGRAGLINGQIIQRYDSFGGTPIPNRMPERFKIEGMNFVAQKPVS